jgi:pimeloyl-ACP methyl ester carboxylesterase
MTTYWRNFYMKPLTTFTRWLVLLVMLCSLVPAAAPVQAAAPAQYGPDFEVTHCMFDVPANVVEGQDVICGYLTVPELHSKPDGATIQLAVVIIKSTDPNAPSDPLVMMQGGPGGSTIDYFTQTYFSGLVSRPNRDIVLFDQRGTYYSKPSLVCPETLDLSLQLLEQNLPTAEKDRLNLEASMACHDRLVKEGVNLAAYNSLENAADVESLRQALGYDQINLYGVSYGTLLALHVMRDYSKNLRSVILDSVVPPQINFILTAPRSENRSFNELFAACAASPECSAAYPNLDQVFSQLVDSLQQKAITVPLTDSKNSKTYQAVFNGADLTDALFTLMYVSEFIPIIPEMLFDLRSGDTFLLGQMLSAIQFDRTMSEGMYNSVMCSEDVDYKISDVQVDGVSPLIAESSKDGAQSMLDLCSRWNVPDLSPAIDQPVTSDVPVLIFNGRFDPITPPENGEAAASTLSHSFVFTFPTNGHGSATVGTCPFEIMQAFLDDPTQKPDGSCINAASGPAFVHPLPAHPLVHLAAGLAGAQSPRRPAPASPGSQPPGARPGAGQRPAGCGVYRGIYWRDRFADQLK